MGYPIPETQGNGRGNMNAGAPNTDKQLIIGQISASETAAESHNNQDFISHKAVQGVSAELAIDKPWSTPASTPNLAMVHNEQNLRLNLQELTGGISQPHVTSTTPKPLLVWDWDIEHEDRGRERKADAALRGAAPFEVDRRVLKDVVREKMGAEVGRITFLSAGTFHKAYLITLVNHVELVARVARRFMPRLKVESEVATMKYLRDRTNVPVPIVYHYDSNPYNRLGGEFILMSKAPGIPLAEVFHSLSYNDLVKLVKNTAKIIIPLFAHRFSQIGSLYSGSPPHSAVSSGAPTPRPSLHHHHSAFPFSPIQGVPGTHTARPPASLAITPTPSIVVSGTTGATKITEFHVGPIISWPFFGSNRGYLTHPTELNRGPWSTTHSYLVSCSDREIQGVIRENEGRSAPHRLHLDPDEINSSRHHRLTAVPGDESDDSDEYDLEESEDEWEGPGDAMYRDYRRMQRCTFLFTHVTQREKDVRKEMERWMGVMERLVKIVDKGAAPEEFGLDCHDLSLENVFVDKVDHTKITCIIDWESTTTRPLWACAHLPAFAQSSPFVSKLFRQAVTELPNDPSVNLPPGSSHNIESLCREWLYYESVGTRLRMAHRCAEWDGWEEGLVNSILGPTELEEEWFSLAPSSSSTLTNGDPSKLGSPPDVLSQATAVVIASDSSESSRSRRSSLNSLLNGAKVSSKLPFSEAQKKEQMLNTTGDICGGRGGELGRRLEAWLSVNGNGHPDVKAILNNERWLEGHRTAV